MNIIEDLELKLQECESELKRLKEENGKGRTKGIGFLLWSAYSRLDMMLVDVIGDLKEIELLKKLEREKHATPIRDEGTSDSMLLNPENC